MTFNAMKAIYLSLVLFSASVAGQSVTLQTSSNTEEAYPGRTVTLTCDVENGFDVTRHHVYWFKQEGTKETFLSADRNVYTSVESSLQRRLSITGDIAQGFFNLRIRNVVNTDAGAFVCMLYDKRGIDKASIRLDLIVVPVSPPAVGYPKCRITPANPRLNQEVTFTCISKGSKPTVSLSWMKGDDILSHDSVSGTMTKSIMARHVITQLDNMVPFTCVARGDAVPRPINCSVVPFAFPTTVNISPPLGKLKIGQDITLTCSAAAIPAPNRYKWTYGRGQRYVKIARSSGRLELSNAGKSLTIRNISQSDSNSPVRCVVRNSLNIKGSKEIILVVDLPVSTTTLPRPRATRDPKRRPITRTKSIWPKVTFPSPNIPMNEKAPVPSVTPTVTKIWNNIAPSGKPPLFDKHQPTNTGRAGLLTGGLIGIACLLGAIFLVALMLMKLKRDEHNGHHVMNRKLEPSVSYTPGRYKFVESNSAAPNTRSVNGGDYDLLHGVTDRLRAEKSLRDSIMASRAKEIKQAKEPESGLQVAMRNNLTRTKLSPSNEETYDKINDKPNRRPNLVFKRFARPLTVVSPIVRTSKKETHSLPRNLNLTKDSMTPKRKRSAKNVEGLLYADLDFANVQSSQNIIPNSCETMYADITTFLKK